MSKMFLILFTVSKREFIHKILMPILLQREWPGTFAMYKTSTYGRVLITQQIIINIIFEIWQQKYTFMLCRVVVI